MDKYRCYADLASAEREGSDYTIEARRINGATVAIIAPHGGGIEPHSERIARAIAGSDFSFYCFRGCKPKGNGTLHITSHRFDEPQCIELLAAHDCVVAIHGCNEPGERVFLGGLDTALIDDLASALEQAGVDSVTADHDYPGTKAANICNRGASGAGVQLELTQALRNGTQVSALIESVRRVLYARQCRP